MTEVVGTDIPQGPEVKWYFGGVSTSVTHTVSAGEVSAGGFALTETAEFGSIIGTVNGTAKAIKEYKTSTSTAATESTGCDFIGYSGIAESDVVVLYYVGNETTGLTHIASCTDVKCDSNASTKTAAVHGQATKLNSVGPLENTADLEEFYYNMDFVGAILGDLVSNSPASGKTKWTNKTTGVKKMGALIGKRYNSSNQVIYKWFLIGAQATGVSGSFPTEDMYKRSMKFMIDWWTESKVVA
jgi:hypothetical protein